MATSTSFKLTPQAFDRALEFWLEAGVQVLAAKIEEITPRDPARPPKNPSVSVTGRLKSSISYRKESKTSYQVWSMQNPTEYGAAQEFWTPKLPPRSYIRKGAIDNIDTIRKVVISAINSQL